MNRTPSHLAHASHFRVLAWFAWLLLAVAPLHGMPNAEMGDVHSTTSMSAMAHVADHTAHAMPMAAVDCCSGQAYHGHGPMPACHCASACTGVLLVPGMTEFASVACGVLHVPLHEAIAPRVMHAPLLRPPLIQTSGLT